MLAPGTLPPHLDAKLAVSGTVFSCFATISHATLLANKLRVVPTSLKLDGSSRWHIVMFLSWHGTFILRLSIY